jgi:hypothetical protein
VPVAQHGDRVRQAAHFVEPVGDEHHADPLGPEPLDLRHQMGHLVRRERRGGFVERDQLGIPHQRPRELDQLALRHRELVHRPVGVDDQSQVRQRGRGAGPHGAAIEQTPPPRLHAEVDVRRGAQVGRERQLLIDDGDAPKQRFPGRIQRDRVAVPQHRAVVGWLGAGYDLEQCGLTRPVLTHQGVDGAGLDDEINPVKRGDAGIPFGDASECEQGHCGSM